MKNNLIKILPLIVIGFISFSVGAFFFQTDKENPITKDIIANAEKLIGLEFTDAERDSMLDGLKEQLGNYEKIREYNLANSVSPSINFNPIPLGFTFETKVHGFITADYSYTRIPENIEDLAYYSIGELAYLIKNKKITSTALTKMYLERLKKFGPKLECVITLTEDLALKQAKNADEEIAAGNYKGLLHGIPYGAKDLLAVKNYKTTWGAMPYKDQVIDEDATVIKKLEAAGAVLIAKLSMGALAWGDVWFGGKTRNPWDTTQGSSGSSAGSAAAVSAGLIPFAIGTETYGSIVSPSTVCGVTGLRPTYGRVSRTGAMALSWSMDKIGPLARNAEDCTIVLNAIQGQDGIDQTLYDVPLNYNSNAGIKKLRVGYLKDDFDRDYSFKRNDSLALEIFRKLGIELIPIKLPQYPINDISIMLSAESAAAFDELTRSNRDDLLVRQIKRAWPNSFRMSRFIPAVEYINASRIRYLLIQDMAKLMNEVDIIIAPSWEGDNLLLTNLTGHPCLVLPNGFSDKGTPTSISIIGNLFGEAEIILLGKAFQSASDFHLKHSPLWKN
jgi:Asp-tRNA(Asn)/Glu-tRNA(Gln) amidotransferase A subunit family amidase